MSLHAMLEAMESLERSQRGRWVGGLLRELLDGPGASLDQDGQAAVLTILDVFYCRGVRGDVVEELRARFSTRKEW